jgi:hypothetical protein
LRDHGQVIDAPGGLLIDPDAIALCSCDPPQAPVRVDRVFTLRGEQDRRGERDEREGVLGNHRHERRGDEDPIYLIGLAQGRFRLRALINLDIIGSIPTGSNLLHGKNEICISKVCVKKL